MSVYVCMSVFLSVPVCACVCVLGCMSMQVTSVWVLMEARRESGSSGTVIFVANGCESPDGC